MTQENSGDCVRNRTGLWRPLGGLGRKATGIPDFLKTPRGVDDMAGQQQPELSYAWEKYMDDRLQGADLQVSAGVVLKQQNTCLTSKWLPRFPRGDFVARGVYRIDEGGSLS